MRTISLGVSESEYDAFRRAAAARDVSIAQLIRDAMATYRAQVLEARPPLSDIPVLVGHKPLTKLPSRSDVYDEIFAERKR